MEYRADDRKHHSKPDVNDNLFCYWYELEWLFRYRFGNGISRRVTHRYGNRFTGLNLCRRI